MQEKYTVKKYYVYKITNTINGKIYIGKGGGRKQTRFLDHIYTSTKPKSNSYSFLHKAINKYGKDNFTYEIINYFDSEDEAYSHEESMIGLLNSNDQSIGYNLSSGGRAGRHSTKSIEKMRLAHIGFKYSEESIQRMRDSHKGKISQGRMFSNEQVKDIRTEYNNDRMLKKKNIINKLSAKYECSFATICAIVRYQNAYMEVVVPEASLPENHKACSVCNLVKNNNEFNKQAKSPDSLAYRCRYCENKVKKISRDKLKDLDNNG